MSMITSEDLAKASFATRERIGSNLVDIVAAPSSSTVASGIEPRIAAEICKRWNGESRRPVKGTSKDAPSSPTVKFVPDWVNALYLMSFGVISLGCGIQAFLDRDAFATTKGMILALTVYSLGAAVCLSLAFSFWRKRVTAWLRRSDLPN